MRRIICLGNPLFAADAAGQGVFALLSGRALPEGVEVFDGGLGGLGLARLLEGARRVVFVDSAEGMAPAGCDVFALSPERVAALASGAFDHAAGLPYLLRALPHVLDTPAPSIAVVAVQGGPFPETLERAATLALRLVLSPAAGAPAEVSP